MVRFFAVITEEHGALSVTSVTNETVAVLCVLLVIVVVVAGGGSISVMRNGGRV